ncbi:MAG: carbohydrate ABC transporter substrate-binding protein [Lachnospiraceae bacterium]|nr:carbohydrate ABC transporter substrate-binding protein [Lachnospiraceae bacterium]
MKESKRYSLIIILLIVVVAVGAVISILMLTGDTNEGKVSEARPAETRLLMSWWGNDARHLYTMEGVDLYQEKTPGLSVEYRYGEWNGYEKRTKVWMESHNAADVMQINYAWLEEYSSDGSGFYDLNELAEYINLDSFTEEEKSYGVKNGKLNALPIAMNMHTFYYNQDVLDAYGLTVPESWDDLFDMAKVMKKDGKYVIGMNKKQLFLLLIAYYEQSSGKSFFNEDGSLAIDQKGIEELLVFYRRLIDEGVLCPVDRFDRADYMSGMIAGTMCWISDTKIYCDGLAETGVRVTRGLYPKLEGAERSGWYVKPATMWAINADTEHPEEAAKLLNDLLTDPDMVRLQQTEKGVPVSDAAVSVLMEEGLAETNEYKATQEMNEHISELSLIIPNMENEAIIDAFKSGADEYLFDRETAGNSAADIYKAVQEVIENE